MKLYINLRKLSGKPTGIGIYIYRMVKVLVEAGIPLIGLVDQVDNDLMRELAGAIPIEIYGHRVGKNHHVLLYYYWIRKILHKQDTCCYWEPNFVVPIRLNDKEHKVVTIVSVHDLIPLYKEKYFSRFYKIYFKYFVGRTMRAADYVFALSRTTQEEIRKFYRGIPQEKIRIIYPILEAINPVNQVSDENFFLFISSIEKRKGLRVLLRAFELYREAGGQKQLFICGKIIDRALVIEIRNTRAYNDKSLVFFEYVDEIKKTQLLSSCSAFIYPSYAEGFGLPPLEAMAYNKPILLSDIEIFKEIFVNNPNWFRLTPDIQRSAESLCQLMQRYEHNVGLNQDILKHYTHEAKVKVVHTIREVLRQQ